MAAPKPRSPERGPPAGLLAGLMTRPEIEAVGRCLIDKAVAGDVPAARFLLERLDPKPRGRPIRLDVAPGADLAAVCDGVLAALAGGRISPDEAFVMARTIEQLRKTRAALQVPSAPDRQAAILQEISDEVTQWAAALRSAPKPEPEPEPAPEPAPEPEPALHSTCNLQAPASDPSRYALPPRPGAADPPRRRRRRSRRVPGATHWSA